MKRTLTLAGLLLMLMATVAFAQRRMDEANERHVKIVEGPAISDVRGDAVTIRWVTNSDGANHVRYRRAGSNEEWQSAYHQGGGTHHMLTLTGLEPGRKYEWQILTRDGDLRTSGEFQTEGRRYDRDDRDRDRDGDRDRDNHGYGGDGRDYGVKVPLYRSSDSKGYRHLYTTNERERNAHGFHAEGPAGYLLVSPAPGLVPLYRMTGRNGDTLLVSDPNEQEHMRRFGYRENGIVGYLAGTEVRGTRPFYRVVSADGSVHFFTTSRSEVGRFQDQGWKEEGIAGYIWTKP
jgi:hypothetical protein